MPVGISSSTIANTLENAAGAVKTRAETLVPKIKTGADQLDGRLAKSQTYQKGKSAFQTLLSHPNVAQALHSMAKALQQMSQKVSQWAEQVGNRAKEASRTNQTDIPVSKDVRPS